MSDPPLGLNQVGERGSCTTMRTIISNNQVAPSVECSSLILRKADWQKEPKVIYVFLKARLLLGRPSVMQTEIKETLKLVHFSSHYYWSPFGSNESTVGGNTEMEREISLCCLPDHWRFSVLLLLLLCVIALPNGHRGNCIQHQHVLAAGSKRTIVFCKQ